MPTPVSVTRTSTMLVDRADVDVDRGRPRRELHRVAEQVEEHLLEPADVAEDDRVGRRRELQLDSLGRGGRDHRFDDVAEQLAEIDLFAFERQAAGDDAREVEQLVDQLRLPGRVVVDRLQRACRD